MTILYCVLRELEFKRPELFMRKPIKPFLAYLVCREVQKTNAVISDPSLSNLGKGVGLFQRRQLITGNCLILSTFITYTYIHHQIFITSSYKRFTKISRINASPRKII